MKMQNYRLKYKARPKPDGTKKYLVWRRYERTIEAFSLENAKRLVLEEMPDMEVCFIEDNH